MMRRLATFAIFVAVLAGLGAVAIAQEQASSSDSAPLVHTSPPSATAAPKPAANTAPAGAKPATPTPAELGAMRLEGEKRFRTNCGRCHMPPHKFPPRTMAMIVRHMRVRAMLTDEDMKLILFYMTQ
jgi:mono/diheme cytochrome c family protein